MADFDLLVLGDASPDLVVTGDVKPVLEAGERFVDRAEVVIGGSGAVTACGAARLGLRTAFAGVVGDDVFGRFVLDALAERGVDVRGVLVDPHRHTGVSVVIARGEEHAALTSIGTVGDLRGSLVDPYLLGSSRHVHVSSYYRQRGLRPDLRELFDEVHRAGGSTSIDPNTDPAQEWNAGLLGLLSATDCLLLNSNEAREITGVDDIDVAAEALASHGAVVGVRFGQGGGLAMRGDEVVRSEAIPASVVDTTGAGDSFDAGFIAARLSGWSLDRCLSLAVTCGSLSTRDVGGTAAQPTMEEALAVTGTGA